LGAAASQVGPDAQAAVVVLNKTFGLSHLKVAAVFRALFEITLTRGASTQIVLRAGDRLQPAYEEVRREIKSAACLTPDETGWRVSGRPAWLHAWVARRATCYAIDPHRKADMLERLIGLAWSGMLVHDGFASCDRFEAGTHQQCLGQLLRRVRDLEAKATRRAVHYLRELIALFTEAIHFRNRFKRGEVSAEQLAQARKTFDGRLWRLARPVREEPDYESLSGHLWQHREEWFTFLSHSRDRADQLGGSASDLAGGDEPEGLGREPHLGGCSRPGSAHVRAREMQASWAFRPGLRLPDPARLRQSFAPTPDTPHPR
jgi:transposase